ncbi:uncharacterized protein LOC134762752 [Penaeus indicus]|uniref:uncharacterized protein LOC134762752 n=1 Tax=Penaeus indicus TaxID=29960 RepID=UPI00300C0CC9
MSLWADLHILLGEDVFVIAVVLTAVLGAPRPQQQQATASVYIVKGYVVWSDFLSLIISPVLFSRPNPLALQPIIPYSYQYETNDAATGNFHNKAEIKTALGHVFGSWSVLMPDGYIYTTSYNVTGNSGFLPVIVKTLPQASGAVASAAGAGGSSA